MAYLMKLALANLLRSRVRTILTLLLITVTMGMYVFFVGMVRGLQDKQKENLIEFETAHYKIRSASFEDERPYIISNFMTDYASVESVLSRKAYVKAFTERIQFQGEIDNGNRSLPIVIVGVNQEKDPKVFSLTNYITGGKLQKGGLLIGSTLSKDLQAGIGDEVFLTFLNAQGILDSIDFSVSGIIESPDPQVNNSSVFIDINDAKTSLNIDAVTEIAVKTVSIRSVGKFIQDTKKSIPGYKVVSWQKLGEYFLKFAQADATSAYVIVLFFAIIAVVGVVNTLLLSVYEKKREIGTLKALGMSDTDILYIFVSEGFWISLTGSLTGFIIGGLVNLYNVIFGLNFSAMMGGSNIGYKLMGIIHTKWDWPAIILGFAVALIAGSLASFYPARKAVKMQPIDCLRTVQ